MASVHLEIHKNPFTRPINKPNVINSVSSEDHGRPCPLVNHFLTKHDPSSCWPEHPRFVVRVGINSFQDAFWRISNDWLILRSFVKSWMVVPFSLFKHLWFFIYLCMRVFNKCSFFITFVTVQLCGLVILGFAYTFWYLSSTRCLRFWIIIISLFPEFYYNLAVI